MGSQVTELALTEGILSESSPELSDGHQGNTYSRFVGTPGAQAAGNLEYLFPWWPSESCGLLSDRMPSVRTNSVT